MGSLSSLSEAQQKAHTAENLGQAPANFTCIFREWSARPVFVPVNHCYPSMGLKLHLIFALSIRGKGASLFFRKILGLKSQCCAQEHTVSHEVEIQIQ